MRVTQSMLNRQLLQNLRNNNERLQKYQDMMATGKRLSKPSDDPVGVSFAMRYESKLGRNEQYLRNLDTAKSLLESADSTVSKVNDILQRARELAVQGANDTTPLDAKKAIASEMDQLYQEVVHLANTKFNGRYIFNGQRTDITPYTELNAPNENTDTHDIVLAVSDGVNMSANVTGQQIFGKDMTQETDNLFAVLKQLSTDLNSDNATGVSQTIGLIDSRMDKIQNTWAEIGARQNRLELINNRLTDEKTNLTQLRSQTEDADMAEVIMNFTNQENVQKAALSAGARVIQPSLVDFLK